eukprot:CAMPEP_0204512302 /NCGR_PEP_ID=MMETSP0661-20131031/889_1 /ASSEMBLY_ACC=CAM_ASM_000606 /TAXON_ID=109239 /ORGANISM="Alexandrium margalefi, Strain AMGDE01CS-322" /LENGTH=31 /DNA_ID= /DNA_START= /DNA_END= /DNA_ORIENTATION=
MHGPTADLTVANTQVASSKKAHRREIPTETL